MTEERLIRENEWLIQSVAKHFYHAEKADLYQAGALGIIKAYQNYQKKGTTKFSSYAYPYVFGEMYQLVFQNQGIKLSKDVLRTYQKIEMARSRLAQRIHKVPNNDEVALFLEMDPRMLEEIVLMGSYLMKSLDEKEEDERSYYETISKEENVSLDDKLTLQDSISVLNKEEQKIITCRYFKDMTQSEVAKELNMTQVMVSRYEKKSIQKMQKYYDIAA